MYLKTNAQNQMVVDCYAMQVYLPVEYLDSAYRGSPYYSVLGTKVRFLGVGNMRFFKDEKEFQKPEKVKCHPLGIPMLILSQPNEIETGTVRFAEGGREHPSVILTYMKGDQFLVNCETIKNTDAMMMLLARLEQGKLDHVPPEVAVSIVRDCQKMNNLSLRIPSEELEIFVAERYRDPDHPTRLYRYHTGATEPDNIVSHNMRTDARNASSFQGIMHEDLSNSLISAINKHDDGIKEEAGLFEQLIRGGDMSAAAAQDYTTQVSQ